MKDMTALRADLSKVFMGLKEGTIDLKTTKAANKAAEKILKSANAVLKEAAKRAKAPSVTDLKD